MTALAITLYLYPNGKTPDTFYLICALLGYGIGYWALFVTIAAEQFGTNIRPTVATTVPNFVRGTVIPLTFLFEALRLKLDIISSAWWVGALTVTIALFALYKLEETFNKDLNFVDT